MRQTHKAYEYLLWWLEVTFAVAATAAVAVRAPRGSRVEVLLCSGDGDGKRMHTARIGPGVGNFLYALYLNRSFTFSHEHSFFFAVHSRQGLTSEKSG